MALYVGDDTALQMLREEALGPWFAGGGQVATPASTPTEMIQTEETFGGLLTLFNVENLLTTRVLLKTEFRDMKMMAELVKSRV